MEQIIFDSGIKEYRINDSGVLRFNPSDPNVYARFMNATDKIRAVEQEMAKKANALTAEGTDVSGENMVLILRETDAKIKKILNEIFGHGNDFDKLLENVNLMAVATNGERVITNLLAALQPIMEDGAKACVDTEVEAAKHNRDQRRALK